VTGSEHSQPSGSVRLCKDRKWLDYPLGTKAYACTGGYWRRVRRGWKWYCGDTFPSPGADAIGACIELPKYLDAIKDKPASAGEG
jgi:hypothetical protein